MIKEKLKTVRTEKNFSQQDVAKYLDINQTRYSRKENGSIPLTEDEWERIAKLLNVNVEEIKEEDKDTINQNFENNTGKYIGSNNVYCNIPEFILENQQDYIKSLKEKIKTLQDKIASLES